jgi:PAS domain S-box-containing protein
MLTTNTRTATVGADLKGVPAPAQATILIVDDIESNRDFLVTLLRHHGHRMVEAADGQEGLAAVRAEHPDLVITDVLMPVMDGYELVRQLRLDPETSAIPVVFYTAHYGEREATALALSSGVSHVLTKPVKSAEVLEVVGRILSPKAKPLPNASPLTTEFDRKHLRLLTDKLSETAGGLIAANAQLRALINIGAELASEEDSDQRIERVCEFARDLFGATYVTVGILDRTHSRLHRLVSCGSDGLSWIEPGDAIPGILGRAVGERRTFRGNNPGGDPARLGLPPFHLGIQAFLAAPIASSNHVFGWICLVGNENRTFTEDDEHLVMVLAGQVGRIFELEREIFDRKQAELALPFERDRAQRYLDTAEVILLALDAQGRITLVNRYACSILGWTAEELLGRDWIDTCLPVRMRATARDSFANLLAGDISVVENPILTKSGEERLIEWRNTVPHDDAGRILGTFSSGADITGRRALEAQYQQAQKMEAIGRLAGGVAHDFNNLLTVILGHCELMLSELGPSDANQSGLTEIQKAGTSAAGLTRQLLAFSRKQIIEPTLLDLNDVVTHLRAMLGRLIGEDVKMLLGLRPDLAFVKADRGQVEQIVVNLAVNARDAMPKGGTLTIETANVELDEEYAKSHLSVKPGLYVALTVSDTGTGMTEEVQARLFEPFFTTKEVGKGTGLGLATVHGIASGNGGSVNVYSEMGRGSSFKVYFPRVKGDRVSVEVPAPHVRPRTGPATVLVVEDAEGLRELTRRLLQRLGYTVVVAANADEARREFERNDSIDVLLTDVVMPGASGPELTKQLALQRPDLKVIYMSGYTEDAIIQHGVLNPGIAFLHKPFTSETLGRKVREVLER